MEIFKIKRIAAALAMSVLAGCASSTAGIWVEEIQGKRQIGIEDPSFATNIEVIDYRCSKTPEGFLKAQIRIKNKNLTDFRCQYRIEWFDKDGMVQTHQTSPWTPRLMHGGDLMDISEVSTLQCSEGFRLKIRWDSSPVEEGPSAPIPTTRQLSAAARKFVRDMVTDPRLKEYYYVKMAERAKMRGGAKPTITFGKFKVFAKGYSHYWLDPLRAHLLVELRKTDYFDVKDQNKYSKNADFILIAKMYRTRDGKFWRIETSLLDIANDNEEVWNDFVMIGEDE